MPFPVTRGINMSQSIQSIWSKIISVLNWLIFKRRYLKAHQSCPPIVKVYLIGAIILFLKSCVLPKRKSSIWEHNNSFNLTIHLNTDGSDWLTMTFKSNKSSLNFKYENAKHHWDHKWWYLIFIIYQTSSLPLLVV